MDGSPQGTRHSEDSKQKGTALFLWGPRPGVQNGLPAVATTRATAAWHEASLPSRNTCEKNAQTMIAVVHTPCMPIRQPCLAKICSIHSAERIYARSGQGGGQITFCCCRRLSTNSSSENWPSSTALWKFSAGCPSCNPSARQCQRRFFGGLQAARRGARRLVASVGSGRQTGKRPPPLDGPPANPGRSRWPLCSLPPRASIAPSAAGARGHAFCVPLAVSYLDLSHPARVSRSQRVRFYEPSISTACLSVAHSRAGPTIAATSCDRSGSAIQI